MIEVICRNLWCFLLICLQQYITCFCMWSFLGDPSKKVLMNMLNHAVVIFFCEGRSIRLLHKFRTIPLNASVFVWKAIPSKPHLPHWPKQVLYGELSPHTRGSDLARLAFYENEQCQRLAMESRVGSVGLG